MKKSIPRLPGREFPARQPARAGLDWRDMMPLTKPDVIITHESDFDGLLSGVLMQRLARKLFGVTVPLEAYHYNYWKQRELREKSAWVADFAFEARLDKADWTVVDHHVTEVAPKYALLIHDLKKSAGLLCYELCQQHGLGSPALDRLVHLNNVADLFLEDDPDFVLAGDYASLVKVYQFWNLHALIGGDIEKLLNHPLLEVMVTKRRVEDPLGFEWSKKNVSEISPTVGYVDTGRRNFRCWSRFSGARTISSWPVSAAATVRRSRSRKNSRAAVMPTPPARSCPNPSATYRTRWSICA